MARRLLWWPLVRLPLALLLALGCTEAGGPFAGDRGRADDVPMVEVGPLEWGDQDAPDHGAFRVESYGATALSLSAGAHLYVEGPVADDGSRGPLAADGQGALDVTLDAPGVYRIIVDAASTLTAICTANCTRPEITLAQFLAKLPDPGALRDDLRARLAQLVPDPNLQKQLDDTLDQVLSERTALDRFPTIPLRQIGPWRPALGALPPGPPAPDTVETGELSDLLGPCTPDRSPPPILTPALPTVGYGHFPNRALTACQAAHSVRLAQILTALALRNGSVVTYEGRELHTPADLMAALVETGHSIEVRNERTYANFLSLTFGEVNVRWPVWLDTGITLPSGETLVVPMGHSQHAWRISGPDVNARVSFFLGIDGAAFFAQTDVRPAWTGQVLAPASPDAVATVDVAARYLRRIRVERATVAAGLPADGYGFLGVCNDSNAVIELATRGSVTAFPLLRAASLDDQPPLGDGLDDLLRELPHDADAVDPGALARVAAMTPSACEWDSGLDSQLRQIH